MIGVPGVTYPAQVLVPFPSTGTGTALRVTQVAVESFTTQPARARTTQLALELYVPIAVRTRTTQLALEVYRGAPARIRLTQHLVELWIGPGVPLQGCSSTSLADPPVGGGSCQAPLLP